MINYRTFALISKPSVARLPVRVETGKIQHHTVGKKPLTIAPSILQTLEPYCMKILLILMISVAMMARPTLRVPRRVTDD